MDFFEHFNLYVQPLNPLGVILGLLLCGAIGGAIVAGKERKNVGMWAARGAAFLSVCSYLGAHIGAALGGKPGGSLLGLFIGGLVGCVALVFMIVRSDH